MKVQVINKSKHPLPQYATEQSAGMDLRANLDEPIVLKPLQRCLVPTGLYMALPKGFEAQVRPRSGLAIKKGIGVLNSPGTIDADYRGEVCVILVNLSAEEFVIEDGERIAQMVISAGACPHSRRGLTPLGRLQNYPKIHVSTGEESSGSGRRAITAMLFAKRAHSASSRQSRRFLGHLKEESMESFSP